MKHKAFYSIILFSIIVLNGFGQEKKNMPNDFLGFEFSGSLTTMIDACSQNGNFVNIHKGKNTNHFNKLNDPWNNIKFAYQKQFKKIVFYVVGGYHKSSGELESSYIDKDAIEYQYSGTYKKKQYYLLIMPGAGSSKPISFYLRPGLGLNYNRFYDFETLNKIITGLDGDFMRIRKLPDLSQNKLSLKLALDIGIHTLSENKDFKINFGMRFITNTPVKLKQENIYIYSQTSEIYLNLLLAL